MHSKIGCVTKTPYVTISTILNKINKPIKLMTCIFMQVLQDFTRISKFIVSSLSFEIPHKDCSVYAIRTFSVYNLQPCWSQTMQKKLIESFGNLAKERQP